MEIFIGILIPFIGTTLGSTCVLFVKKGLSDKVGRALTGFAAGVMVAASIWSLIIPAIEQSSDMGKFSFVPAFVGVWFGLVCCFCFCLTGLFLTYTQKAANRKNQKVSYAEQP